MHRQELGSAGKARARARVRQAGGGFLPPMQPIKVNRVGIAALVLVLIIAGFAALQLELFGDGRQGRARFERTAGVGGAGDLDTETNSALSKINAELGDLRSERYSPNHPNPRSIQGCLRLVTRLRIGRALPPSRSPTSTEPRHPHS